MQLVSVLAAGVKGAEAGSATLYSAGTSTPATVYSDWIGTTLGTNTVALDDNGGAEVYVSGAVDVEVRDSSNALVRRFTVKDYVALADYVGASFTGTDPTDSSTGAQKPVSLQTILDAWKTSAGALDFKVLVAGSPVTLQTAMAMQPALVYNVMSSTYGATGDAATDDRAAIQSALDAAHAAGGGIVFLPKGTYRISSYITLYADTWLAGVGNASKIAVDGGGHDTIRIADATGSFTAHISDVSLWLGSGAGGGANVVKSSYSVNMERCYIGGSSSACATLVTCAGGRIVGCTFQRGSSTGGTALSLGDLSVLSSAFVESDNQFLGYADPTDTPITFTNAATAAFGVALRSRLPVQTAVTATNPTLSIDTRVASIYLVSFGAIGGVGANGLIINDASIPPPGHELTVILNYTGAMSAKATFGAAFFSDATDRGSSAFSIGTGKYLAVRFVSTTPTITGTPTSQWMQTGYWPVDPTLAGYGP